jgi:hypothetical protein
MDTIAELPFLKLGFDDKGVLEHRQQVAQLIDHISAAKPERLVVVSHGWRNDEGYATALYTELFTNVADCLKARGSPRSSMPAVVGVYWPAMALPEEFGSAASPPNDDGAAAALADHRGVDPNTIRAQLEALKAFGGEAELEQTKALLDNLEDRPGDQIAFVKLLRSVAPPTSDAAEDNSDRFFGDDAADLFDRLTKVVFDMQNRGRGDDESGAAAGLRETLAGTGTSLLYTAQGALGSAFRLVNYLTFYQMKERAGVIGLGLNQVLGQVRSKFPDVPIHLVGHSFGARVITAAAARGANLDPCSLSLLQGAYSHNGLAASSQWGGAKDGYFRSVFSERRVSGPIVATHTANDQAVGVAYPIACRLAGQNAEALGDANDPYGGVGRNGVLHVVAMEKGPDGPLLPSDGVYSFAMRKTNNLLADSFIKDHGDVKNPAVANAVAQVILSL